MFAPSRFNSYASSQFPGVIDILFELGRKQGQPGAPRDEAGRDELREEVKRQMSIITAQVIQATAVLKPTHDFQ